jgi:hypothetical protein
MAMRDGFHNIVAGWTLISGIEDLTDRIEHAAEWTKENGPLEPDEKATINMMIRAQFARGMEPLIRRCGLDREFGLPPEEEEEDD